LVLAAQFESFRDPFIILAGSVPLALSAALTFSFLGFTTLNIYSQVGLITLVGLVAKNGILIVQFANQLRERGTAKLEAVIEAAGTRLLHGRDISWSDTTDTPYVAIVNATFAQKMWGETSAIGQRFILQDHLTEVIGVVEDGKYYQITDSQQPVAFVPLLQTEHGVGRIAIVRRLHGDKQAEVGAHATPHAHDAYAQRPLAAGQFIGGAEYVQQRSEASVENPIEGKHVDPHDGKNNIINDDFATAFSGRGLLSFASPNFGFRFTKEK